MSAWCYGVAGIFAFANRGILNTQKISIKLNYILTLIGALGDSKTIRNGWIVMTSYVMVLLAILMY